MLTNPVEILRNLIRFNTTNPPGNERDAIFYLNNLLASVGIETKIIAKDVSRPNLLVRYKGLGIFPPLLLHGHIDVVGVDGQDWQHPPFEGRIINNEIWGRGAIDMKSAIVIFICTMLNLKSIDFVPNADIILAILSDEEAGGFYGAQYLVNDYPSIFENVKYAISEGGGYNINFDGVNLYPITVAEKRGCLVEITIRGLGGHGSIPLKGGTMSKLGVLLKKISHEPMQVHVTSLVKETVRTLEKELGSKWKNIIKNLQDPHKVRESLDRLGYLGNELRPLFQNTINPTVVQGGSEFNVVPSKIKLWLDARILPGYDEGDLFMELTRYRGSTTEIHVLVPEPEIKGIDWGLFELLCNIIKEEDPNSIPFPSMLSGSSDARIFARLGIQTYGFIPMKASPHFHFRERIHNANERLPTTCLDFGIKCLSKLIQTYHR